VTGVGLGLPAVEPLPSSPASPLVNPAMAARGI
jgi:hypothetical protein